VTPRIRKLVLTSHVTFSVGWLGAVVAYLAVAIVGLTSLDLQLVRGTYATMQLVAWFVIVPFAIAALLSGVVQSLATEWGLLRHYWVIAKFALTTIGTVILLLHAPRVSEMAVRAAESAFATGDYSQQRLSLVVHAGGGLAILLAATILSVFKPWGKTAHGRGDPRARKRYLLIGAAIVLGLIIVFHLEGGVPRH
jgi:ABC-type transport system involved in multi-copper enzyme maturation permease subunit